jgi:hypothetical protein
METTQNFELHYLLRDDLHTMHAVTRNKCESELLAVVKEVAKALGIEVRIETQAYGQGGLKEFWKLLGANKDQLTLIIAIVVLLLSRIPPGDSETETYNKEAAKLTVEEKKLNIEKLKRELNKNEPDLPEKVDGVTKSLQSNPKIATRRSNFYRNLLQYNRVTGVGFSGPPLDKSPDQQEQVVYRTDFFRYVLLTDELPDEVVEGAVIEIVSPVLRAGNYLWKGIYEGTNINFAMNDDQFKSSVLNGKESFQHGTAISCVLKISRKLDGVGDLVITGYSVSTVLSKVEGSEMLVVRRCKSQLAAVDQGNLFEDWPKRC